MRTWTDRSKSFSVDAQFLGMKDGKLNLHKVNGVKIAVPIVKMSVEDLEYVERVTGISLDEDKPLSEVKRQKSRASQNPVGATVQQTKKSDYDWFQFFLSCDIQVGLCERYAQAFARDNMDESVLSDVDASVLRTLGLREGDIIKVMRYLDNRYGRKKKGDEAAGEGGLFSGPGGALKNNTGRPRPEANRSASDLVDPKALGGAKDSDGSSPAVLTPATTTSALSTGKSGFDDDAWDVKPARSPAPAQAAPKAEPAAPAPALAAPEPLKPALTPGMQELSLLSEPLQPTKTAAPVQPSPVLGQPTQAPNQAPQLTGASPGFFAGLPPQQTGLPNGQSPTTPLSAQLSLARQRPAPPSNLQGQAGILPPPARPLSAPQSAQPSGFAPPPLAPHVTGQVAPPGQSLQDLAQQRMQQQYAMQMQPQMTGFPQQQPAPGMYPMQTGMQPQPTGFGQNQFMQQQMMNGQQMQQSPFADPRGSQQFMPQPTGFQGQQFNQNQFGGNPQGGINSYLPPALEPQRTGMPQMQPMQPQPTGMSFTQGFGNHGMASSQPQPPAPLMPQQTGPPPPVRFGVQADAKRLAPQATGRRANLSAASKFFLQRILMTDLSQDANCELAPDNPFGF